MPFPRTQESVIKQQGVWCTKTIANVVDAVRGVRWMQCRGRHRTAVANNWSLHHECYWEALLILSSSFWESCKGVETATTSNPARLLCIVHSLWKYTVVGCKLWREKNAASFQIVSRDVTHEDTQYLGFRTWKKWIFIQNLLPFARANQDSRT